MIRVNMFVDKDTELVKESSKKAEAEMAQESSLKRAGDELEQEKEKKQKIDDDQEEAEMKKLIKIVKEGKISLFQIIRANGSSKRYSSMIQMLRDFDREDLETLWKLSKEEHEVHLKLVLELLKKEKLFAKFSKCELWLQEVHFLGHVVNNNGNHVHPSKIEAVKNRKVPKTPSEIQSFLGLAGYYRRFITNFSKVAKPLTSLTWKNQKYEWGKEQEEAFQTLKDNLCNASILSLPEGSKDFVVYCDALNQGFRYLEALLIWDKKYYLHGSQESTTYFDQKELNMRQRRWIELFSDYDCEIRYHPRKSSVRDKILVAQSKASKVKDKTSKNFGYTRRLQDDKLAMIYIDEIVARHGVLVSIISDCDGRFTSRFWQTLQKALRTCLDMCTAYHPLTDGQSERTIQTLEDMLRACVINFGGSWDTHLPLAEFSYNNIYHSSIRCAPFVALYGRKCRSSVLWAEVRENRLIGPEMVQETTDKVVLINERLKVARDLQKSYADNRRKPLEFEVGEQVLQKVSPWKGVMRFGKKGKLAPRYVGPFEIIKRIGPIAY
ncbi:putative reverse transcriptase domain-containing protein [Tanacetum coccineum]